MKKQIRYGVFETNSSSIHSLTMCMEEQYNEWRGGKVLFHNYHDDFKTKEEAIEELKEQTWLYLNFEDKDAIDEVLFDNEYFSYEEFWDYANGYEETFEESFTTPKGDTVIVFGYSGYER